MYRVVSDARLERYPGSLSDYSLIQGDHFYGEGEEGEDGSSCDLPIYPSKRTECLYWDEVAAVSIDSAVPYVVRYLFTGLTKSGMFESHIIKDVRVDVRG